MCIACPKLFHDIQRITVLSLSTLYKQVIEHNAIHNLQKNQDRISVSKQGIKSWRDGSEGKSACCCVVLIWEDLGENLMEEVAI